VIHFVDEGVVNRLNNLKRF